jgi:hypothetical protein
MKELEALLLPAKVVFLIFSDESIPVAALPENSFLGTEENAVQDMYTLAECDYILGPPSTFSMWASYYGGRPLFMMHAEQRLDDLSMGRVANP